MQDQMSDSTGIDRLRLKALACAVVVMAGLGFAAGPSRARAATVFPYPQKPHSVSPHVVTPAPTTDPSGAGAQEEGRAPQPTGTVTPHAETPAPSGTPSHPPTDEPVGFSPCPDLLGCLGPNPHEERATKIYEAEQKQNNPSDESDLGFVERLIGRLMCPTWQRMFKDYASAVAILQAAGFSAAEIDANSGLYAELANASNLVQRYCFTTRDP